nr:histone-lysine N-methyltransferase, H3 lysine-9 specific SUVH4 isoform X2 [Tanacetum cinerariifolium]
VLKKVKDVNNPDNMYIMDIDCLETMRRFGQREKRLGAVPISMQDSEAGKENVEFCIDTRTIRNVTRYINHSCQSNLFVQYVLSAHDDITRAQVTLFATDNIQPLKTILLGLPEDIYAIVDSCETAQEIWQIAQPGMNMGQDRQMQMVREEYDLMAAAADIDEIKEVNANRILMANLQQASTSGTQTDNAPVYDSDRLAENDNDVISEDTSVEQGGEIVEQHPANFEKTRALYGSLYQNLAIEVEKVNSVNRKLKETNADLTTELARFKNQTRCFEISQEKYDKLERCYQQSVYQEQCLFIHLSDSRVHQMHEKMIYEEVCYAKAHTVFFHDKDIQWNDLGVTCGSNCFCP